MWYELIDRLEALEVLCLWEECPVSKKENTFMEIIVQVVTSSLLLARITDNLLSLFIFFLSHFECSCPLQSNSNQKSVTHTHTKLWFLVQMEATGHRWHQGPACDAPTGGLSPLPDCFTLTFSPLRSWRGGPAWLPTQTVLTVQEDTGWKEQDVEKVLMVVGPSSTVLVF